MLTQLNKLKNTMPATHLILGFLLSIGTLSTGYASSDVVVQLPLDEGNGLIAGDISGMGNNGTLVNDPQFEANTGDGSAFAVRFDEAGDAINLGVLDVNGTGLTLAAWFNATSFPGPSGDPRIISKAAGTSSNDHVFMLGQIRVGSVTRLRTRVRVGGITTTLIASSGDVSTGVWRHAATTYDGSTLRLYLDGVEVGSTPLSGPVDIDPTIPVAVGNQPAGAGERFFDGLLDDIRILQRPMSTSELAAIFNGNQPPVAVNDDFVTTEDTALVIDVANTILNNDTDAELDVLQTVLVSDVSNGVLNLIADGSFSYTPALDFNGTDSFTYQANDGSANSNVATVTLAVNGINDAPVALNDEYQALPNTTLTINAGNGVLTNDTDAEMDALQAVLVNDVSNGALTLNPDGSFDYTPAMGFTGVDSFTYRSNDTALDSNPATVTLAVIAAPTAVNDSYSTDEDIGLTVPAATGVLLNDEDNNAPDDLTASLLTNPTDGTLTDFTLDGGFTYTPNPDFNGMDSFTYEVVDGGNGAKTQSTVNLTVNAINDAPVAMDDGATTTVDTAVIIDVLANDIDVDGSLVPDSVMVVVGANNGTAIPDSITGTITFTPSAGFSGNDSFTYTVQDSSGAMSNQATVNIQISSGTPDLLVHLPLDEGSGLIANDISGMNNDGTLINNPVFEANTGDGSDYAVRFDGVDDAIDVGNLDVNGTGLTLATWFNAASFPGPSSDPRMISKAAGTASNDHVFMLGPIRVNSVMRLRARVRIGGTTTTVVSSSGNVSTGLWQHAAMTYDGTALRLYLDGVEVGSTPLSGAVDMDPSIPVAVGNQPPGAGARAFDGLMDDIRILQRALSTAELANIAGINGNQSPVAANDSYVTSEDATLVINIANGVLTNDTDADLDILQAVLLTNVANGALNLAADGSFDYTPAANFSGTDSFTYRANDGSANSNVATVTLTVNEANDAPVAIDDEYQMSPNTTLFINANGVLANDTDAEMDVLQSILLSDVSNGTLTLNTDGSFDYTPTINFTGSDSFTYRANDAALDSNPATVTIVIIVPPTAEADSYSTNEDMSLTISAATGVLLNDGDNNPPNDLTANLLSNPSDGTLSAFAPDGGFTYIPNPNFNGVDSFTYEVVDGGNGAKTSSTVTLTINAINDAPVAQNDGVGVQENTTLNLNIVSALLSNDSDVDEDTLSFADFTQPVNGSIVDNNDGTMTYTPPANFVGTDSFTYRVSDGQAVSNIATVLITVTTANPGTNNAPIIITGSIGFLKQVIAVGADLTHAVAAADLDADGDIDVVTTDFVDNTVFWYENDGNGGFVTQVVDTNLEGAYPIGLADVDGDGNTDILAAGYHADTVVWYQNNGAGVFIRRDVDTAADGAHSVIAGDMDQDGDNDLLTTNQDAGTITWYENNGANEFTRHTIDTAATGAKHAELADFNDDGNIDVVAASYFVDEIAWYENDGNQNFTKRLIDSTADGAYFVSAADIDNDGDTDVLAASRLDDTITLYLNNGAGAFTAQTIDASTDGVRTVIATDINSDGNIDILAASVNDDTIAWYRNDGNGQFVKQAIDFLSDGAYGVFAIDIDHDNDIDVLSANRDAGTVELHSQIRKHSVSLIIGDALIIGSALLQTTDSDDGPTELTYTVTEIPGSGELQLNGSPLSNGNTFTQDDIDNNRISYQHNGLNALTDVFSFTVADGGEFGVNPVTGNFTINITDPIADAESVIVELPLDDGSGLIATDVSGKENNGVLVNGASFEMNTGDGSTYAVRLDGLDDAIDLGVLDVNGTGLTLAAWFNADSFSGLSNAPRLISKASGTAANDHVFMLGFIQSGSQTRLRARVRSGGVTTTLIAGNISAGAWRHAAVTYDGATLRLYLDGMEVGGTFMAGAVDMDPTTPVTVGSQPPGAGGHFFDGLIDEVHIIQRALSENEINALFTGIN